MVSLDALEDTVGSTPQLDSAPDPEVPAYPVFCVLDDVESDNQSTPIGTKGQRLIPGFQSVQPTAGRNTRRSRAASPAWVCLSLATPAGFANRVHSFSLVIA